MLSLNNSLGYLAFRLLQPMDRIDHNGPNFHYIIAYRRTDGSDGDQFIKEHITDYTQSK